MALLVNFKFRDSYRYSFKSFAIALVLVLPSFVWIILDNQPFGGDQSAYGMVAVQLSDMLLELSPEWPRRMLAAVDTKGPGIAWVGQFVVPLGILIGSIDHALLFLVTVTLLIGLWLIYCSVLELSDGSTGAAFTSTLAAASAPLFVDSAHLFLIEPFQFLIVAWFVTILSFLPKWDWVVGFGQLLLAACAAILVRATTPVYVWIFGLVILGHVIHKALTKPFSRRPLGYFLRHWSAGFVLLMLAFIWYGKNLRRVLAHSRYSATGTVGAVWGKEDTYLNTLTYWFEQICEQFFTPLSGGVLAALLLTACFLRFYFRLRDPSRHFFAVFVLAICQIVALAILFALSSNRLVRFVLPLLPYLAVAVGWVICEINRKLATSVAIAVLGLQWWLVYGVVFGRLPPATYNIRSHWILSTDPKNASVLEDMVSRTCSEKLATDYLTIVAIDPTLRGDWLAPVPAAYAATKRYGLQMPCEFGYAGVDFFGAGLEETWKDFSARRARYIIISDPSVYPPPQNAINQSLTPQTHGPLLNRIKSSGAFVEERPLETDSGILIFRRSE